MNQDRLARKIVANLLYRYRFARRLANDERLKEYSVNLRKQYEAAETEAWNAYASSKQILNGCNVEINTETKTQDA